MDTDDSGFHEVPRTPSLCSGRGDGRWNEVPSRGSSVSGAGDGVISTVVMDNNCNIFDALHEDEIPSSPMSNSRGVPSTPASIYNESVTSDTSLETSIAEQRVPRGTPRAIRAQRRLAFWTGSWSEIEHHPQSIEPLSTTTSQASSTCPGIRRSAKQFRRVKAMTSPLQQQHASGGGGDAHSCTVKNLFDDNVFHTFC